MDAANVDLKSMRDEFYREYCGTRLAPVLDTPEDDSSGNHLLAGSDDFIDSRRTDSAAEVDELTAWVATNLGVDTPLHFDAFHPDGQMLDVPATQKRFWCERGSRRAATDCDMYIWGIYEFRTAEYMVRELRGRVNSARWISGAGWA